MPTKSPSVTKRKFGYNFGVSTTQVEVRSEDANLAYQTANQALEILSGDAADLGKAKGTLTLVSAIATDIAIVNGLTYTGVAGVKANNTEFSIDTSDTAAAADLADSINNDTRHNDLKTVPTAVVVATSALGVVTITVNGTIGNLVDISSPDATITASGATLTDAGTGAHSVQVQGVQLNSAGNLVEIEETIFLDGVTAVALTKQYYRVNRAYILEVGSGLVNAGLITVRLASAGAVQATIPLGEGQTQLTNYTGSTGKNLVLQSIDFSISSGAGNAVVVLIIWWVRIRNQGWRAFGRKTLANGAFEIKLADGSIEFPADSDFKVTAEKLTGTGDGQVEVGYSYTES